MPRSLDNWLLSYLDYTKHLEAPDIFHFFSGIATIAGALRGKTWIDMTYWKWKPNFFIIFVAPPGVIAKSTTIGIGEELLSEIDGIHFGPHSATWQGLTKSLLAARDVVELPGGKSEEHSPITIIASELGTFLDPKNKEMIDVLVDLWDGRSRPWRRHTSYEGEIEIPNPWINFIGATTPSWINENFPEYAIGGGFVSRTVFVYGEKKRHYEAYPGRKMQIDNTLRQKLVEDLAIIANMKGPFTLTDDAYEWGTKWYEEHCQTIESASDDRLTGYLARKQTHIHKLAMILSAARADDMRITASDLTKALRIMDAMEASLYKVFSHIAGSPLVRATQILIKTLARHDTINEKALWRLVMHTMSLDEFSRALDGIVKAGLASLEQVGSTLNVRSKVRESSDLSAQQAAVIAVLQGTGPRSASSAAAAS